MKSVIRIVAFFFVATVLLYFLGMSFVDVSEKSALFSPTEFDGEVKEVSGIGRTQIAQTGIGFVEPTSQISNIFNAEEKEKIVEAQAEFLDSTGREYAKLASFLDEQKGDLNKIKATCSEFSPIVCLREASRNNPDLREEICDELRKDIQKNYGEEVDVEQHYKECMLGLRPLVR